MSTHDHLYARPLNPQRSEDCLFYHVMEVPGEGLVGGNERFVGGQFDLRGREDEYLGHVPLNGRRVLEIGPAAQRLLVGAQAHG
jgi:hypothetical protein